MRTREKSTGFRCPSLVYSFPIYPSLIYSFLIYSFLIYLSLTLPGEPPPPTLTLAFVGDVMLGRGVAQALDGDWDAAFVDVQPWLAGADLAFANLESPLTTVPFAPSSDGTAGRYDLRAPPEAVAALRGAGFDVVSLANNHALDAGPAGLAQTAATLGKVEIAGLVDDGRIYPSTHLPVYRLLAFDDSVAPLDVHAAALAVAAAADEGGLVIVSVHWGGEYQASSSPRQRAVAQALAHAGAGLVIGHGPHVLQRVEWVGETLVAYSLGNFLFDQPYPADCRWGAVLRVAVRGDRIVAVDALPTVVQRGRVRRAASEDAAAILARLALDPVSGIQYQ
jgi:poly-gamma-glutamate capsule biosynthesis protein CapA/YwtB (metallophosphatase superfamily)